MNRMHPLTLSFHDSATERAFARHRLPRLRLQGRAAIIVGIVVDVSYAALEHRVILPEQIGQVWLIRVLALLVPAGVLVLTYSPCFEKINQLSLSLVGFTAALGLIGNRLTAVEQFAHGIRQFWRTGRGVLLFVVVAREPAEVIDEGDG